MRVPSAFCGCVFPCSGGPRRWNSIGMCVITPRPVCSPAAAAELRRREPTVSQRAITTEPQFQAAQRRAAPCCRVSFCACLCRREFPRRLRAAPRFKWPIWLSANITSFNALINAAIQWPNKINLLSLKDLETWHFFCAKRGGFASAGRSNLRVNVKIE